MGYYTCKICQSPIRLSREAGKQTNIDHRQVAGELKKTNATFGKLEDLCGAKSGRWNQVATKPLESSKIFYKVICWFDDTQGTLKKNT